MIALEDADETDQHICDICAQLEAMEQRLATHVVGSIAVGVLIVLGCMLGLTSVLLQHG